MLSSWRMPLLKPRWHKWGVRTSRSSSVQCCCKALTLTGVTTCALDYLRQGIHLRGYAQKQPKQEYKREAFELFRQLIDHVKNEVTKILMTVQVQSSAQLDEAAQQLEARAEHITNMTYTAPTETGEAETTSGDAGTGIDAAAFEGMRVGRNDPCPCGSGKKYKQCHGKLA